MVESKRSKKLVIVMILVTVVLVIGGIAVFHMWDANRPVESYYERLEKYVSKKNWDVEEYYAIIYGDTIGQFRLEEEKIIAQMQAEKDGEVWNKKDWLKEKMVFEGEVSYSWDILEKEKIEEKGITNIQKSYDKKINCLEQYVEELEKQEAKDSKKLADFYKKWLKKLKKLEVTDAYNMLTQETFVINGEEVPNGGMGCMIRIDGDWIDASVLETLFDDYEVE